MPPETDRTNGWLGRKSNYFHPRISPFALSFRQASSADFNRLTRCRQTPSQIATALLPCGGSCRSRLFILETTCCNPCLVVGYGSDITQGAERDSGEVLPLSRLDAERPWMAGSLSHRKFGQLIQGGVPSRFVSTTVCVPRRNAASIRAVPPARLGRVGTRQAAADGTFHTNPKRKRGRNSHPRLRFGLVCCGRNGVGFGRAEYGSVVPLRRGSSGVSGRSQILASLSR